MATRFYLPSSGTAPLASLAVDANWELTDGLSRRPMDVVKSNTSIVQKSALWSSATTQQWCWVQYQSKRLAAGYTWTTGDLVSMVIKVAESIPQGDSHLAYVVRVVSGDGATIRGIIGLFHATSTEYPTSLANIATRIHSDKADGATNFSSQAGDRIIIEIGHHGVSPDTGATVYHNLGDPSATADYALTAALTTDLCPWVELSRTVSFILRSSKTAYLKGSTNTKSNKTAYTNGANPSYNVKNNKSSYLSGTATTLARKSVYLGGQNVSKANKSSYLLGNILVIGSKSNYLAGISTSSDSQSSYLAGQSLSSSKQTTYLYGQDIETGSLSAYINGSSIGTDVLDSQPCYMRGFASLVPDGEIGQSGTWLNEAGSDTNIWQSIDETESNDADYIYNAAASDNDYYEVSLSNPDGTPGNGNVVVHWRGRDASASGVSRATIQLRDGATVIASMQQILTSTPTTYSFTLTSEEKANITNWNDLRIRMVVDVV